MKERLSKGTSGGLEFQEWGNNNPGFLKIGPWPIATL